MSDANERWRVHAPFEAPQRNVAPAAEPDRSWMPMPTTGASGIDWHKDGKWREVWKPATTWAAQHEPAFAAKLEAAERELGGLERSLPAFHPKLAPARAAVSRHYAMLGKLHDQHVKSLPFIRY